MTQLSGYCLCKAISFTIPMPTRFDACHCIDCRRWHGVSIVGIDSTEVTLVGDTPTLKWFSSSDWAERGFCGRCGSSLFYRLKSNPAKWSVYIGTLTNIPKNIPLGTQYFLQQKPNTYALISGY
ncbi:MAG: GFA family protein [Leptolyngbya sp. SIO3F4]|nr:GFA family protein [Leptolyngbya sp. SIO3F4]